jgi:teichuronic acid biosynthesis glycosyltransferase TuaG
VSLVSIIMPAYNAEKTLAEAVDSVLAQIWPDWELLLVVDKNSSDRTHDIATSYATKDRRVKPISGLSQGGCVFNRNQAIQRASGGFLAFLDSDDLWLPEKLKRQVEFMERTGCDLSYTGYAQMNWTGQRLPHVVTPPARLTYDDLLNDNLLGCLTAMVRRSRFPDIRFEEHLHEDFILWLRLLRQTVAQGLPDTLAVYRQAAHSRSGNKVKAALARWRILRHYENLPLTRALPCFLRYAFGALRKRKPSPFQESP